jgi:hypothetical protein
MSTHPYGNNFKVTVTKYTDEDLDIVTDQLNLEIKSDKPIRKKDVCNGLLRMFNRGYFGFDIEVIDGKIEIGD